jgi:hypothetical protein
MIETGKAPMGLPAIIRFATSGANTNQNCRVYTVLRIGLNLSRLSLFCSIFNPTYQPADEKMLSPSSPLPACIPAGL